MKPLHGTYHSTAPNCVLTPALPLDTVPHFSIITGKVLGEDGLGLISQVVVCGDDAFFRIHTALSGLFTLKLPPGRYRLEITKGSEYERKIIPLHIRDASPLDLGVFPLHRLYETDWIAGDLHQHSCFSDGLNTPSEIALSDLSMGMRYSALTDHNDIRGNVGYQITAQYGLIPIGGLEITSMRGHYNVLPCCAYIDESTENGAEDIRRFAEEIHAQPRALAQINHPTRAGFEFVDRELAGLFDTYEIWNGKGGPPPYVSDSPNASAVKEWFSLIRDGVFLAATAGSDNHDVSGGNPAACSFDLGNDVYYAATSLFSGMPRTYVHAAEHTENAVLDAVKAGHSFMTNNPLAYLSVDGAIPGETAKAGLCRIRLILQSNRCLQAYRLYKNGESWIYNTAKTLTYETTLTANLKQGDWVVLEVLGENGDYAITNPVFIQ